MSGVSRGGKASERQRQVSAKDMALGTEPEWIFFETGTNHSLKFGENVILALVRDYDGGCS